MNRPRSYFQLIENNDKLFAIGWAMRETIDIHGDQWVEEKLPFNIRHVCSVSINDFIVVIGGMNKYERVSKNV